MAMAFEQEVIGFLTATRRLSLPDTTQAIYKA